MQTPLWQIAGARFMPPVSAAQLPVGLLERFTGAPTEALLRLLTFLAPITIHRHPAA